MIEFDIPVHLSGMKADFVNALKCVMDPELNVNIVDLGLVYTLKVDEVKRQIQIKMTLSSAFCPMSKSILSATKNSIERTFPGFKTKVKLVWEPEWGYHSISAEGLKKLDGG